MTVLLAALCVAMPALASEYVPIQASSSVDPKTITGPQSVNVTIRIVNTADGDLSNPVILYDPAGTRLQEWASMKVNDAVTYTGSWDVTADELAEGKLKYKLSYTIFDSESSQNKTGSMVVSVPINKTSAAPKLNADYTISPTAANKGQTITLTYTISNVGNVAVRDVTITNPNLTDKKVTIANIPAGQRATKQMDVTMGSKALTSKPKVTYKAEGDDTVYPITNMPQKTIELAQSGLTVNLKVTDTTEVLPGETAELNCVVENTGNLTYTNLRIVDEILGEIVAGVDLKPGEKHTEKRTITVTQSQDHTFVVTAEDSTGSQVTVPSNTLSIIAVDLSQKLQLSVSAEATKTSISSMPEVVGFSIRVVNEGQSAGTELTVNHGDTTVAGLSELLPGESVTFVKEFDVSMGGKFEFVVSGKGGQGIKEEFTTNVIEIPYIEPTPEPIPTPVPVVNVVTPEPEPTPEPSIFEAGGWILYAGIGLLALLIILLVLFLLMRRRAGKGGKKGDDAEESPGSMRMGTRRNYTGSEKHRDADDDETSWDDEEVSLYDEDESAYGDRDLPDDVALSAAQAEMRRSREERDDLEEEETGRSARRKRSYEEEAERYGRPERRSKEEASARRSGTGEAEEDERGDEPPRATRQSRSARRMGDTARWNLEKEADETPRQVPYHAGRSGGAQSDAQDAAGWDSAYRAQDAFRKQQTGRTPKVQQDDSAWDSAYRRQDAFRKQQTQSGHNSKASDDDTGTQSSRKGTGWDSAYRAQHSFAGQAEPENQEDAEQAESGWDSAYRAQGTSGAAPLRQDTGFYRLQRQQDAESTDEAAPWETSPFDAEGDDPANNGIRRRRR